MPTPKADRAALEEETGSEADHATLAGADRYVLCQWPPIVHIPLLHTAHLPFPAPSSSSRLELASSSIGGTPTSQRCTHSAHTRTCALTRPYAQVPSRFAF